MTKLEMFLFQIYYKVGLYNYYFLNAKFCGLRQI